MTASSIFNIDFQTFTNSVRSGVKIEDIVGGVIKPLFFGLIIGIIACYKGLKTSGGTAGVGRSTTSAVVLASIVVIILDFFLSRALQFVLGANLF